jgi:hypothetical protein
MTDLNQLRKQFLGGDPIAGNAALGELVAQGAAAEMLLFSSRIEFPTTVQRRRRWLSYIGARRESVEPVLLERMIQPNRYGDGHTISYLIAGLGESTNASGALYAAMMQKAEGQDRNANDLIVAYLNVGGDPYTVFNILKASSYLWEKCRVLTYRAACGVFARTGSHASGTLLQNLISRHVPEASSGADVPSDAIDSAEPGFAAWSEIVLWHRGDVVDEVLRYWTASPHWRIRYLGALVLAAVNFQRSAAPLLSWLALERDQKVRDQIVDALGRTRSPEAADYLLREAASLRRTSPEVLTLSLRHAVDTDAAAAVLADIAAVEKPTESEAVVSLARLGRKYRRLQQLLDSQDAYCRTNAALAAAYLGDRSVTGRLRQALREAAGHLERIGIASALAILKAPRADHDLDQVLIQAAAEPDFTRRVDIYMLKAHLQDAILDGLKAAFGEASKEFLAWAEELRPLNATPAKPVRPARAAAPKTPKRKAPKGSGKRSAAQALKVFISYSHSDEPMRRKLEDHLAPLVGDNLIRLWHDREIDGGADWEGEIKREMQQADVVLLLISRSFLGSPYCRKELLAAIDRRQRGKLRTVPIILRSCDWQPVFNRPKLAIQALPRDNKAVASRHWHNQDEAFTVVARELRTSLAKKSRRSPAPRAKA